MFKNKIAILLNDNIRKLNDQIFAIHNNFNKIPQNRNLVLLTFATHKQKIYEVGKL